MNPHQSSANVSVYSNRVEAICKCGICGTVVPIKLNGPTNRVRQDYITHKLWHVFTIKHTCPVKILSEHQSMKATDRVVNEWHEAKHRAHMVGVDFLNRMGVSKPSEKFTGQA